MPRDVLGGGADEFGSFDSLRQPLREVGYTSFAHPVLGASNGATPPIRVSPSSRNPIGRPLLMTMYLGVVAAPGQNGHFLLQIAPPTTGNSVPAEGAFVTVGFVACRNNQAIDTGGAAANIANGSSVTAFVPVDAWYRLKGETISGFAEPTFAAVGSATFIAL